MLAGRDLYKDRVENGANPGRGLEDIYIQVDANIIIASFFFFYYYFEHGQAYLFHSSSGIYPANFSQRILSPDRMVLCTNKWPPSVRLPRLRSTVAGERPKLQSQGRSASVRIGILLTTTTTG